MVSTGQLIPGGLKAEDVELLTKLANGKNVLQLGCHCGKASVILARCAWATWIVEDFFRPDGLGSIPEELKANADRYFPEDSEVNLIYSPQVGVWVYPEESRELPEEGVDVVYRDADRREELREQDDLLAHGLLPRGGVYAWHDQEKNLRWLQIEPVSVETN